MTALIILILLLLAALAGGLIAMFAGRRNYALWAGYSALIFHLTHFRSAIVPHTGSCA